MSTSKKVYLVFSCSCPSWRNWPTSLEQINSTVFKIQNVGNTEAGDQSNVFVENFLIYKRNFYCHKVRKMCSQTGAWIREPSLTGRVLYRLSYPAAWHFISHMVTKSILWHIVSSCELERGYITRYRAILMISYHLF